MDDRGGDEDTRLHNNRAGEKDSLLGNAAAPGQKVEAEEEEEEEEEDVYTHFWYGTDEAPWP